MDVELWTRPDPEYPAMSGSQFMNRLESQCPDSLGHSVAWSCNSSFVHYLIIVRYLLIC